jgi:RNA polymerase sigma-70 factor (ECF subfamily)
MTTCSPDTEELLRRAAKGNPDARDQLLARHRDRLRKMVSLRLDRRARARIDPSDVVQETLLEADRRLADYLRDRPLPFYPWLRRLAWERLVKLHRRHVHADKRSVGREEHLQLGLSSRSAASLAQRLIAPGASPSQRAIRAELRQRVRDTLEQLNETDREVLVMRYLEQLSVAEIAATLGISEAAVKMRHARALSRLSKRLERGDLS